MKRTFPSEALAGVEVNGRRSAPNAFEPVKQSSGSRTRQFYGSFLTLFCMLSVVNAVAKKSSREIKNPVQPVVSIPVLDLGYQAPGVLPAFYFHAIVSLHFIDDSHLLFTFEKKGLLSRNHFCPTAESQRMVRAVVLDIPSGKVEKRADWELYDFDDYLWGIGSGQFLLRRCSQLNRIGLDLELHPLIHASGEIEEINFSSDHSVLAIEEKRTSAAFPTSPTPDRQNPPQSAADEIDVQFVRIHPLGVISRARLPIPGTIPITDQGILEALSGKQNHWTIDFQSFQGAARDIVTIQSTCMPRLTVLTNNVFVAGTCSDAGARNFEAYDFNGALLWRIPVRDDRHYLRFLLTKDGIHFAIESLHGTKSLAFLDPGTSKSIDAEIIDIYDMRTGVSVGSFRTTPVYTAGKNADFSPDGTRLAVLHNGTIEIYLLSDLAKNQ